MRSFAEAFAIAEKIARSTADEEAGQDPAAVAQSVFVTKCSHIRLSTQLAVGLLDKTTYCRRTLIRENGGERFERNDER
jgi:hypothetical protein